MNREAPSGDTTSAEPLLARIARLPDVVLTDVTLAVIGADLPDTARAVEQLRRGGILVPAAAERPHGPYVLDPETDLGALADSGSGDPGPAWTGPLDYYRLGATAAALMLEPDRVLLGTSGDADGLPGPFVDAAQARAWFDTELPALLRTVERTAVDPERAHYAYELVDRLWSYWLPLDKNESVHIAHRHGLHAARVTGDAEAIGRMLTSGALVEYHDDPERAIELVRAAHTHHTACGHPLQAARTLHYLGLPLAALGRTGEAKATHVRAVAACLEHDDRRTAGLARLCLAHLHLDEGDTSHAAAEAATAHAMLADHDPFNAARAHLCWGLALTDAGDPHGAERHLAQAAITFHAWGADRHLRDTQDALDRCTALRLRPPGKDAAANAPDRLETDEA